MLLAIDLGLKTAWSLWNTEGYLCRFESRNFPNKTKLKSGAPTIIRSLPPVEVVIAEGDARLAKVWFGFDKSWETQLVQAQQWRRDILFSRDMRRGSVAKEKAVELASRIVKHDGCGRAAGLNHDTAEAILLGYWAVLQRGWRLEEF
jgi:hypothetical protein